MCRCALLLCQPRNENATRRATRSDVEPVLSFIFQASTASGRITAPRRRAGTGPSVARSRTATSARVHLASPGRIARTTSTSATGTRACTVSARTSTGLTSKSKHDSRHDRSSNRCPLFLFFFFFYIAPARDAITGHGARARSEFVFNNGRSEDGRDNYR